MKQYTENFMDLSVYKYRKNYYVLYPIGKEGREKIERPYGGKVYAVTTAED